MKFRSTRCKAPSINFSDSLFAGLATDGGLYVPEIIPQFDLKNFSSQPEFVSTAQKVISTFVDELPLKNEITEICNLAFDFPILLKKLNDSTSMLELYHGPSSAFKDFGARFLAQCLSKTTLKEKRTVIVATSGDTGGAVAGAFHRRLNFDVIILYPKGMVSEFQEKQLTCWGDNVRAFKVCGTFDDCQRMVKEAFADPNWKIKNLISANSINIGRILPQSTYYAWASLDYFHKNKKNPGFIIPSGNLGNSLSALWAKKMGFPIGKIVLAFNANTSVVDYFKTGLWNPRPTILTLANAMDVGNPSNMERLRYLYPDLETLKRDVEVFSVTDDEIKSSIQESYTSWGRILCPHTATAALVRKKLTGNDWIVVATADAAKFRNIVEPIIGQKVPMPTHLQIFEKKTGQSTEIKPTLAALATAL